MLITFEICEVKVSYFCVYNINSTVSVISGILLIIGLTYSFALQACLKVSCENTIFFSLSCVAKNIYLKRPYMEVQSSHFSERL